MSKNNGKVELYCILDRSGSMGGKEKFTIDGFNEFIERQSEEIKNGSATLVLFDDKYEVVYSAVKMKKVSKLNEKVYFVRGMTALNDAVAKTLKMAKKEHKANGEPDKAICLIVTDGYENDSKEYPGEEGRKKVKKMIKRLQDKKGWDFFFIGSEIDAVAVGSGIGIPGTHSATVSSGACGTRAAYTALSVSVTASVTNEEVDTQDLYDELLELELEPEPVD